MPTVDNLIRPRIVETKHERIAVERKLVLNFGKETSDYAVAEARSDVLDAARYHSG